MKRTLEDKLCKLAILITILLISMWIGLITAQSSDRQRTIENKIESLTTRIIKIEEKVANYEKEDATLRRTN